ncbi:MAG: hypothetical protein UHX00_10660 [Caryophanon sp.]|nr:hypothetical protein [Caryophanon sp.]
MAGYNYEYMLYAKFPNDIDEPFLQRVTETFTHQLEQPTSVGVHSAIESAIAYFNVRSLESVPFDEMDGTIEQFKAVLKQQGVQYIGYVQSYNSTVNNVDTFEDPVYEAYEYIEQEDDLHTLLRKTANESKAHSCLEALQMGRIDETEADHWIECFREFDEWYFNSNSAAAQKLQRSFKDLSKQIQQTLLQGFAKVVATFDSDFVAEEYNVAEAFNELWEEQSDVLQLFMDQMEAFMEQGERLEQVEEKKEQLLQHFESAGFANFEEKLDNMSDDEIEQLYVDTFK